MKSQMYERPDYRKARIYTKHQTLRKSKVYMRDYDEREMKVK